MCELFASQELFFLPCFGCSKQGFVVSRRTLMEAAELVCFVGVRRSCRREQRAAVLSLHQESKCFCCVTSRCAQTSLTCSLRSDFPRVGSQPSAALTNRGGRKCWLEAFFWSCKSFWVLYRQAQVRNCAGFHIKTVVFKFSIQNTSLLIQNQGIIGKAAS